MKLRMEDNIRKHVDRNNIINANSNNKRLFFTLIIKKHRKNNNFIDDLYVGNELFQGGSLTNGWQKHFKQLAEPTNNIYSNYDMEHLKIM